MKRIIFVTGGQRSGKSSYAQGLAESLSANPLYLATARRWDEDFEQRIKRHQAYRGNRWTTIEEDKLLSRHQLNGKTVLMDCVTLWLTNIFDDNNYQLTPSLEEAKAEWDKFTKQDFTLIVVSNEIGMSLHGSNQASRDFTDLQGWVNQHIARNADEVFLLISGIPVKIK